MESPENQNNLWNQVAQRIILEIVGVAVFFLVWTLVWQARDPTSWIRLRLAEAQDKVETFQEKQKMILELREGLDYWDSEDGVT